MDQEMASLMDQARAALHLDRPCPRCGAPYSAPCRTAAGKYLRQVHAARLAPEPELTLF